MRRMVFAICVVLLFGFGSRAEEVNTSSTEMAYPQEFSDSVYTLEMGGADRFISICAMSDGSYSVENVDTHEVVSYDEFDSDTWLIGRLHEMVSGNYTIETHGRGIIQLHDARLDDFLISRDLTAGEDLHYSAIVNETTSFFGELSGYGGYHSEYMVEVDGAKKWAVYDICGQKLGRVQTGRAFSLIVEVDEPSNVTFHFIDVGMKPSFATLPPLGIFALLIAIPLVAYGWVIVLRMRKRGK